MNTIEKIERGQIKRVWLICQQL